MLGVEFTDGIFDASSFLLKSSEAPLHAELRGRGRVRGKVTSFLKSYVPVLLNNSWTYALMDEF